MPQQAPSRGNPIQDYITVAERIEKFYRQFPDGRIITHIVEHDAERGFILMRAEIYRHPDDALPAATGHAFEYRDAGHVQRTSYIETGETSAVGRALALCGFEVKRGIASREVAQKPARKPQEPAAKSDALKGDALKGDARKPSQPSVQKPNDAAQSDAKENQPATEDQKQSILDLLGRLRPGDRRAQQRLLAELTGKESRDDLTRQQAGELIYKLKKEAAEGSI